MGFIRKTLSVSTLGVVPYRSGSEKIARALRGVRVVQPQVTQQVVVQQVTPPPAPALAPQRPTPSLPQAGWYADPHAPADLLRWWDGRQWGPETAPRQP